MNHGWSFPFLMAASLALFACQSPPTVNVEVPTSQATTSKGIFVTGEGEVTVTPDLAVMSLQVQVRDARAGAAWNRAAQAMTAVTKALTDGAVASQDIKTQGLSLQLITTTRDRVTIQEYQALNTITAKVRRLDEAGRLVDAAVAVGGEAARVLGLSFTIDDATKYRDEARGKAMQDAEARAKRLAQTAGVRLGKPESIAEGGGVQPVPFEALARGGDIAAAETPVSPGTTIVRVVVSVRYAIEP